MPPKTPKKPIPKKRVSPPPPKVEAKSVPDSELPKPEVPVKDPNAWYNSLPPLEVKPDAELHKRLSAERKQKHREKVAKICEEELQGMLNLAFDSWKYRENDILFRRHHRNNMEQYRYGAFIPKPPPLPEPETRIQTEITPAHYLEMENYLHISSESILADLAKFFDQKYDENYMVDNNKYMSDALRVLQDCMQPFLVPYKPPKIHFPHIICVTGPEYSGKTTLCHLLSKALDVHIIDIVGATTEKKKKGDEEENDDSEYYPLNNSTVIHFESEKTIVTQICNAIQNSGHKEGFVICGYPINKAQFGPLEKGLQAQMANVYGKIDSPRGKGNKTKNLPPAIHSIIITMHAPANYFPRRIHPKTGAVFTDDFHKPGMADLEDVIPLNFGATLDKIESECIEYNINSTPNQKLMAGFVGLEALKKNLKVLTIPTLESEEKLAEIVDEFLSLTALSDLLVPSQLILPAHAYRAICAWRKCLETFGRTIADQGQLVSTLPTKIDTLCSDALNRFALLISCKDRRSEIVTFNDDDRQKIYNLIWEESVKIRDKNVSAIEEIVDKSGIIDMVLELKKAPKIVFIALTNKIVGGAWFRRQFARAISGLSSELEPIDIFANPFKIADPPKFDNLRARKSPRSGSLVFPAGFSIASIINQDHSNTTNKKKYTNLKKEERKELAEVVGFQLLADSFESVSERDSDCDIKFDLQNLCNDLNICVFDVKSPFDQTLKYAEEVFNGIIKYSPDPAIQEDARVSMTAFRHFVVAAKKREVMMVNAVFDLRDNLNDLCQRKLTKEMENFSRHFLDNDQTSNFEYALEVVPEAIRGLAEKMCAMPVPIIVQNLIPFDHIKKVIDAVSERKLQYTKASILIEIARTVLDNEDELSRFEICTRLLEAAECIDVPVFFESFTSNFEELSYVTDKLI